MSACLQYARHFTLNNFLTSKISNITLFGSVERQCRDLWYFDCLLYHKGMDGIDGAITLFCHYTALAEKYTNTVCLSTTVKQNHTNTVSQDCTTETV